MSCKLDLNEVEFWYGTEENFRKLDWESVTIKREEYITFHLTNGLGFSVLLDDPNLVVQTY